MSVFLRLYPRAWRERYADEVTAILEARPTTPSDRLDLALGAIDAHLRARSAAAGMSAMPPSVSARVGGLAAMLAGLLWVGTIIVARNEGPSGGHGGMLLLTVTVGFFVVAIAALARDRAGSHARLRAVSLVMPGVGVGMLVIGMAAELIVGGRPVLGDLTPYAIFIIGLLLGLVGCLVAAITAVATGALTCGAGWLLFGGVAIQALLLFGTDHDRDAGSLLTGAAVFSACWVIVGLQGVRRRGSVAT